VPFEVPRFENIEMVSELAADSDTFKEENPTLTADGLEVYFTSNREGGTGSDDVWMARRSRTQDAFGAPVEVASVNTEKSESSPAISPDGKLLWIGVEREGGVGGRDIWRFERQSSGSATTAATFGDVTLEPNVNTTDDDIPRPLGNGLRTMPLASRIDMGIYQTYFATRSDATGSFGTPALVQELVVDERKLTDAFLTDDGLTLYFVRATNDDNGDIYVAHRNALSEVFQSPEPLTTINGDKDDRDPWLSPDGSEFYFVSNRDGAIRIYRATRAAQ
jgi:Tol biopolymer transport system component